MGETARVTLSDVAERAGVSIATASRALAGRGELGLATRERVLAAATALGYDRGTSSRGRPSTLDTRLIELVLGSFDDAWTDEVTAGARRSAFEHGYDLVLTLERDDPADDWPARVATRRPSGVILGLIRPTRRQLTELRGLRIPLVLLDPRSDPNGELASVGTTDHQGGYDAGAHLAATGLGRFAVITGTPRFRFGKAREEGFRRAIAEHAPGAPVTRVDVGWDGAGLSTAIPDLFSGDRTPVGVFACNDAMALAVYPAARRAGLRIPADISVIGFDDEPRSIVASPPLTSVHQPLGAMAARAVALVHEMRARGGEHFDRIELPTRLVLRQSTLATPPRTVN
ncbi:transcriptional regulator [Cryobacterium zongtaii]|uniref:Transcriptional regulator n=1 Tax=Cryobacterium zongtaii TaxID=1259217 RepID=A0A2S3ZHR8_9MICO|nr:LacI family DNA-binding transcriptional regulator [Cryobacterium zongtaii]POH66674.1 transcriptional regulator [Cryobacterium zongtaii]